MYASSPICVVCRRDRSSEKAIVRNVVKALNEHRLCVTYNSLEEAGEQLSTALHGLKVFLADQIYELGQFLVEHAQQLAGLLILLVEALEQTAGEVLMVEVDIIILS